jgi:hypothetical protein
LKRAYRFCWNPPCALGSKEKDCSCSRAAHWCIPHVHSAGGPSRTLLTAQLLGREQVLSTIAHPQSFPAQHRAESAAPSTHREDELDGWINIVPNGSSGTHAGLAAGFAALGMDPGRIRSFAVLQPAEPSRQPTIDLARRTLARLHSESSMDVSAIDVSGEQCSSIRRRAMVRASSLLRGESRDTPDSCCRLSGYAR